MFIAYKSEMPPARGVEIARADTLDGAISAATELYAAMGWQLVHAEHDAEHDGCADMCFTRGRLLMAILCVEPIERAAKHARLVEPIA